jgi:hypothetical protein
LYFGIGDEQQPRQVHAESFYHHGFRQALDLVALALALALVLVLALAALEAE